MNRKWYIGSTACFRVNDILVVIVSRRLYNYLLTERESGRFLLTPDIKVWQFEIGYLLLPESIFVTYYSCKNEKLPLFSTTRRRQKMRRTAIVKQLLLDLQLYE